VDRPESSGAGSCSGWIVRRIGRSDRAGHGGPIDRIGYRRIHPPTGIFCGVTNNRPWTRSRYGLTAASSDHIGPFSRTVQFRRCCK
jgi:hypothetical protein